jgi:hypoxanthine phosphoribosyltransferase
VGVVTARSNRLNELDWRQVIACSEGAILSEIREIMTWDIFGVASRELAIKVAESGYEPDIILAIARGGLLSAGAYTMNVEFYTGVNERLAVPMILPPVPSLVDLKDSKVLIVDDVADTGHTLKHVLEFCKGQLADTRLAVLYEKSQSIVKCDYVWKYTDEWINFPWSDKDPVAKRKWSVKDA